MTWHPDKKQGDELVKRVLSRTSGSACARAQGFLPDLVAGQLAGLDGDLVKAHVEHCSACQSLIHTLGWLDQTLPEMVRLDPGMGFTRRVLENTSRAPDTSLLPRLRRWWERQLLRPNFAAELAYVATVVLVLLTAVPGAPLESAPRRAEQVIKAGPAELPLVEDLGDMLVLAAGRTTSWTWSTVSAVGATARDGWRATAGSIPARNECSRPARVQFSATLTRGLGQVGQGHLADAVRSAGEVLGAAAESWRLWWHECE